MDLAPSLPTSQFETDLIWFPIRVTAVGVGPSFQFVEVWQVPGGAVADKIGGRVNSTLDPAYAIDGSTFVATAAGTAVQALARRAPGAGGVQWELKGFGGSSPTVSSTETIYSADTTWSTINPVPFTETSLGQHLYFATYRYEASGTFSFRWGIGVWPVAFATPNLAAAAGKLAVLSQTQYSGSGSAATNGATVAIRTTSGLAFVAADFPLNVTPIYIIDSGSVSVIVPTSFVRL